MVIVTPIATLDLKKFLMELASSMKEDAKAGTFNDYAASVAIRKLQGRVESLETFAKGLQ